jgi:hypothetical protein
MMYYSSCFLRQHDKAKFADQNCHAEGSNCSILPGEIYW